MWGGGGGGGGGQHFKIQFLSLIIFTNYKTLYTEGEGVDTYRFPFPQSVN